MELLRKLNREAAVCNPDRIGRILNSDQSGRTLALRFKVLPFRRISGVWQVNVLSELKVGETGILVALDLPESVQNHLMHMGFVPDARVTALRRAPAGDPTVYAVDGIEIALRHETAEGIRVRSDQPPTQPQAKAQTHASAETKSVAALETPELLEAAR